MNGRVSILVASVALTAACATTRPSPEVAEARGIYQTLMAAGADRRVEADLLRANTAIVEADAAFTAKKAHRMWMRSGTSRCAWLRPPRPIMIAFWPNALPTACARHGCNVCSR